MLSPSFSFPLFSTAAPTTSSIPCLAALSLPPPLPLSVWSSLFSEGPLTILFLPSETSPFHATMGDILEPSSIGYTTFGYFSHPKLTGIL
ncbi:hypothetical protein V6N13_001496 [Hibiscus sabdariffa]|uniref:Uncharacterized protein n=1 Tax=Hibiscus sabdariffa TaxID=183260 RepID=A0ABR2G8L4_9ROSI